MPTIPTEGITSGVFFTLLLSALGFVWKYQETKATKLEAKYETLLMKQRENYEKIIANQKLDVAIVHAREIELHKQITELKEELGSLRTKVEMLESKKRKGTES